MDNLTEKEKKALKIANNALYFDDNSDYQTALWKILAVIMDKENKDLYDYELKYIDD